MKIVTSADAQNRFEESLDKAQREPLTITRSGSHQRWLLGSVARNGECNA